MKINTDAKKNILGFKPDTHWKIILTTSFFLVLCAIGYNIYLFAFAENQINAVAVIESTSTPAQISTLASPEKIQEYFKVYKDRETAYSQIIKGLVAGNKVVATTTLATTSSSTVIATTTNQ